MAVMGCRGLSARLGSIPAPGLMRARQQPITTGARALRHDDDVEARIDELNRADRAVVCTARRDELANLCGSKHSSVLGQYSCEEIDDILVSLKCMRKRFGLASMFMDPPSAQTRLFYREDMLRLMRDYPALKGMLVEMLETNRLM